MIWQIFLSTKKYVTRKRAPESLQKLGGPLYRGIPAASRLFSCTQLFGGFFVQDAGMLCFDSFRFMIGIDTMRWDGDAWPRPSCMVTWAWQLGTVNISLVSWMVGVGMPKGHVTYSFCERKSSQNDEPFVKADNYCSPQYYFMNLALIH